MEGTFTVLSDEKLSRRRMAVTGDEKEIARENTARENTVARWRRERESDRKWLLIQAQLQLK